MCRIIRGNNRSCLVFCWCIGRCIGQGPCMTGYACTRNVSCYKNLLTIFSDFGAFKTAYLYTVVGEDKNIFMLNRKKIQINRL